MNRAFDPERLRRARAYRVFRRTVSLIAQAVRVATFLVLYLSGASTAARDAAPRGLLGDLAAIAFALGVAWLLGLPFAYVSFRRGRTEGLIVESLATAVLDELKSLVLALILVGVPFVLWYAVLPRTDWWALTIAGAVLFTIVAVGASPLLATLFFRFEPLADAQLASRIARVAERTGIRILGVYRWGISAKYNLANAAVAGVGPTKRIVISDTLLDRYPPEALEAVVAHEIAHQVYGDTRRFIALGALSLSATLLVLRAVVDATTGARAADAATFPLLLAGFEVASFALGPALLAYSRRREYAADAFGARYTSAVAMGDALVRLADHNLADPEPPAWEELVFQSHPSTRNRVQALGQPWPPATDPAP